MTAEEELQQQITKNLQKAAIFLVGKVREKLNTTGQPKRFVSRKAVYYRNQIVSAPGQPPHKETGTLQRSITYEMRDGAAYVGTNINYAAPLELGSTKAAARPFLQPTLLENRDTITKIVATGSR